MAELEMLPETKPATRGGLSLGSMVLLAGIMLVAGVFAMQLARQRQTQPESGAAPDFMLTTLQGETITLSNLRGKVVVINFWASWCGPCRVEAPVLERIWQQYKDRGVVVLGVAYTDTESAARAFIAEFNQTYPNGLDLGTRISEQYRITGVPETYVVDQNGDIAWTRFSAINEKELGLVLDKLLAAGS